MGRGDEGLRVRWSRIPGETMKGVLERPLVLPAVIGDFGWTEEFSHSEYDTVRAGQFSQPSLGPTTARTLRELDDMETLAMVWDPPWLVESGQDPEDVRDRLLSIGRSRTPVMLLVSQQFSDQGSLLRMAVTVRSISAQLRKNEPDTIYYRCRIREWRNASARRRGQGRGDRLPTTHGLADGDTLHSLAMRYYHTVQGARVIANANGIRNFGLGTALVKHAKLKVGSKVKIPKASRAALSPPSERSSRGAAGRL